MFQRTVLSGVFNELGDPVCLVGYIVISFTWTG